MNKNYCSKCDKEFSEKIKFCTNCGSKIQNQKHNNKEDKKEEHVPTKNHYETSKKISPHLVPWVIFSIFIIILGILLLPTRVLSYTLEVPYIDKEKYTVEVPYEDIEEYVEKVPYETKEQYVESVPVQKQENVNYKPEWIKCSSTGIFFTGESTLKITNLDPEPFTFNLKIGYIDNSGNFVGNPQSKTIGGSSSDTFTYSPTPNSFKSCSFQFVIPPIRGSTEYKDVIKEKTVTKYRDETKYRKTTKMRTETREKEIRKTRTETKRKEVNWLFGFNAIIKFRNL